MKNLLRSEMASEGLHFCLWEALKNTQALMLLNCVSTSKCDRNYLSFHSDVETKCQAPNQSDEMNSWVGMLYFLYK